MPDDLVSRDAGRLTLKKFVERNFCPNHAPAWKLRKMRYDEKMNPDWIKYKGKRNV